VAAATGKGDLFGSDIDYQEAVIKSSCDVKSLTYCDLQCIQLNGLKSVLHMYPEFGDKCANDLLHDLTYNLREGYIDPEDDDVTLAPAITLPSITEETSDEQDSVSDEASAGSDGEGGETTGKGGTGGVDGSGVDSTSHPTTTARKNSPCSPPETNFR